MTILQVDYTDPANTAAAAGIGLGSMIFGLLLFLFYGYCLYKIFQKAGIENAWMGFIPVLSYLPLLQIAKKPTWWLILMLIPLVNFIILILVWLRVAKAFGKGDAFGIGLALLGFIFIPILAFGDAQYNPNILPDETGKAF